MNIQVIILAAGKGVRMNSDIPKALRKVKGVALIERVLNSVLPICSKPTIIVGYRGEEVIARTKNQYHYVEQKEQLGTGHAVLCARDSLASQSFDAIMVVPGDLPCVSSATLEKLAREHIQRNATLTITTAVVPHFDGEYSSLYDFGRIIRDQGENIINIVELKDCNEEQKKIKEVNIGLYCFEPNWLWENLPKLSNNNKAREYYLTDMIKLAVEQGLQINSITIDNPLEGLGINTLEQLRVVEKIKKREFPLLLKIPL